MSPTEKPAQTRRIFFVDFFLVESTRTQPEATERHRQSPLRAHSNTPENGRFAAGGGNALPFSSVSVLSSSNKNQTPSPPELPASLAGWPAGWTEGRTDGRTDRRTDARARAPRGCDLLKTRLLLLAVMDAKEIMLDYGDYFTILLTGTSGIFLNNLPLSS